MDVSATAVPSVCLADIPRPKVRKLKDQRTLEVAAINAGLGPVAGVDEAGRGACAGPLVVASCLLPAKIIPALAGLTDSKKLSPRRRQALEPEIKRHALAWSVVVISAADIDVRGIQYANTEGMRRAVAQLYPKPGFVLTDALRISGVAAPSLAVIGGDLETRCIAAASVLAKQARDRIMVELDKNAPGYGFALHKGYGTRDHFNAIVKLGASDHHRMSYKNVRAAHQLHLEGI